MAAEEKPPSMSVRFKQQESNQFRIIHTDGVFGGPTPGGLLYVTVYSQIPPLPSEVTQEVLPGGALGKEIGRVSGMAIERRLEAGLIMDLTMAKAMRDWLTTQIAALEDIRKGK